jgi:outer membrane protein with beta-barrel domain
MKARSLILAAVLLSPAAFVSGQIREGTTEIEPFVGYLWGGQFDRGTTAIFTSTVDVEDHLTFGGRIGYNFTNTFEIEGLYERTETHFETHDHNGGPVFGGNGSQRLGDLDIDYFLGYATFNFGHSRAVPYVTFGMGAAHLNPDVPGFVAESDTRYTVSAGTGVKVFFTPHFGMRFDGRYFGTLLNNDHNHDCHCHGNDWLSNWSTTGGLLVAF